MEKSLSVAENIVHKAKGTAAIVTVVSLPITYLLGKGAHVAEPEGQETCHDNLFCADGVDCEATRNLKAIAIALLIVSFGATWGLHLLEERIRSCREGLNKHRIAKL